MRALIFGAVILSVGLCGLLNAQAVVNETLETAFLWVDTANGNDSNPGTQQLPLQTIGAAAAIAITNNHSSIGTQVTINPGIYRESLNLSGGLRNTNLPITFQAAIPGTVTVSGALPFTSWNNYDSNIYSTPWSYQFGFCPPDTGTPPYQAPIVLRTEMTYVNGTPMTQVMSMNEMLYPGTFFVDEVGGTLYLWPPSGINPSVADVEISVMPTLVTIYNMNGVVFRNLAFKYANSCYHSPAVLVNGPSQNILFDTVSFDWNNGEGIAFNNPAANVSVINSTANHNGAAGYQAYQTLNSLWQNDTASFNNWRGAQGVYYEWGTGGAHIFSNHSETWTNFTVTYNQTHSMHWDTDVQNATMTNTFASGNLLGTLIEKNLGPITISNSTFCGAQVGIALRDSSNVTLSHDTLYDNAITQILLSGDLGGIPVSNWVTGTPYTTSTYNLTLIGNQIESNGTQQLFKDGYLGGGDWTNFAATLTSSNNLWWNATNGAPFTVPTPSSGTLLNFQGWQGLTSQDITSTFSAPATDPGTICNSAPVDYPDWWFVVNTFADKLTAPSGLTTTNAAGVATYNVATMALGGWNGTATLAVDGLEYMPGGSVSFNPPTLTGSATSVVTVTTTAATPPGTYALTVLANSGDVTRTMALDVTVPVTSVLLSTAALNFPNQPLKITSAAQSFTMTNFGQTPIAIASVVATPGFAETNNCGLSLGAGASCTINVTFTPKQSTPYTGMLTITDNDATGTQIVTLTGTSVGSPTISLSLHMLSFGGVTYGSTSAPQSVTITNTGTGVMNISSITITGAGAASYKETDSCAPPLEVNDTCGITVTMSPTALGTLSATVTIYSNSTNNPQTFTLSGSGLTSVKVSPTSVSFGSVTVSKTSTGHAITISNLSTSALSMNPLTVIGSNPGDFILSANTCGSSLAANGSCSVTATFVPTTPGSRSASLSISDSDLGSPQAVTFTGTAVAGTPTIKLSVTSLAFGNVDFGSSVVKTETITNTGTANLNISSIGISGATASSFHETDNCNVAVPANGTCTITVTLSPAVLGTLSGTLTINSNATNNPQSVSMSGTGLTSVKVSPTSVSFGSVTVSKTSTGHVITISNLSPSALSMNPLTVIGSNPGDFILSANTCGSSLAANGSCTVTATFAPTTSGSRSASLSISDSDPGSPQAVTFTGTAVAGTPTIKLSVTSLAFGNVDFGSSVVKTETITNTGTANLNISSIGISGTTASSFHETDNCNVAVPANGTCTITVTLSPAVLGTLSGTLTINSNATNNPQSVSMSGTGLTSVKVSPTSVSFGTINVGKSSTAHVITISNLSTSALSMHPLSVIGGNPGDFVLTANTCGSSLAGGASCSVTATFTPTSGGARSGSLSVVDADPASPQSVSFSGSAKAISVSPASINFGTITVGKTSVKTVTVTNAGTGSVSLSSIQITGANAGDFTMSNNTCGSSLPGLGTCSVDITFAPPVASSRSATWTLTDSDLSSPSSVTLSGSGK